MSSTIGIKFTKMNEETAGGSGGPFQPQEGTGGQLWGAHGSVQQGGVDGKDHKCARTHDFAFVQQKQKIFFWSKSHKYHMIKRHLLLSLFCEKVWSYSLETGFW